MLPITAQMYRKRGDLIVVDPEPTPTVTEAVVAGTPVYRADTRTEAGR